jgi:hypothetical protein
MAINQLRHLAPTPLVVSDIQVQGGTLRGQVQGNVAGDIYSVGVSTITVLTGVGTAGISSAYISTLNDGPLAGSRNKLINGDFRIDQRNVGAAQSISVGAALSYTVDRWYAYSGTVAIQGQQVQVPGTFVQNRYQFTKFNQVTSTAVLFAQRIESQNSFELAGNVATISLDAQHSASLTPLTAIGWTAYYPASIPDTFGSIATPTKVSFATGTITANNAINRYSTSFNVAMGCTMGLEIVFSTVGIATTSAATSGYVGAGSSTQGGGGSITFGNVQIEKGPTATPFERRHYSHELLLCQRYFEKTFAQNIAPVQNSGTFNGSITGTGSVANVTFGAQWWFKSEKFATPSVVTYTPNAATATWSTNTTTPTLSGAIFGNSGIYLNGTTAVTAGNNYSIHAIASSEL